MQSRDHTAAPAWTWRFADARPGGADFAQLAHFVSVGALEGLNLRIQDSYELATLEDRPEQFATKAVSVLRQLYDRLRSRGYQYDLEPWHVDAGVEQRLRDPRLIDRTSGTCIDFALMFAAMCKANHLRPYLVIVDREGQPMHAIVVVATGFTISNDQLEEPVLACREESVAWQEHDRASQSWHYQALSESALSTMPGAFAVDVICACQRYDKSFEQAVESGDALLGEGARTVDVVDVIAAQFAAKDAGAPPPIEDGRPAVYRRLPPRRDFVRYPGRAEVEKELKALRGNVALIGAQGTGKSMLAHQIAQTADEGSGWFLDASTPNTLLTELAEAEARELGRVLIDQERADLEGYATRALHRLRDSRLPWVVVLDNADGAPRDLGKWRPQPDPARGQLVIVTTTNGDWAEHADHTEQLEPLGDEDMLQALPALDQVGLRALAGRPLLVDASRRFHAATGEHWWNRPGSVDPADPAASAPAGLWRAIREAFEGAAEPSTAARAVAVARAVSWFPATSLGAPAIAAAVGGAVGESREAIRLLHKLGLVDLIGQDVIMHRLFRTVVRSEAVAAEPAEQVSTVRRMLAAADSLALLQQAADIESAELMYDLVADHGIGGDRFFVFHRLGRLLERYDVDRAARWYDGALVELGWQTGADVPAEQVLPVIDCLRGKARPVYRKRDFDSFGTALGWIDEAVRVGVNGAGGADWQKQVAVSEARALGGLLIRAAAGRDGDELAGLRRAERILHDSYRERRDLFDAAGIEDAPDLDRSRYNLTGLEVRLAKLDDHSSRLGHLMQARTIYDEIRAVREKRYQTTEIDEVAACINGVAIVDYYRALLPETQTEHTALIRSAFDNAVEAVRIRRAISGAVDDSDTAKSLTLLVKVVLFELALLGPDAQGQTRDDKAVAEYVKERTQFLD